LDLREFLIVRRLELLQLEEGILYWQYALHPLQGSPPGTVQAPVSYPEELEISDVPNVP